MPRPSCALSGMFLVCTTLTGCLGPGKGDGDLTVSDSNNYSFTVDVALDSAALLELHDDTLDWSALTTSMRGSPITPADIEIIRLIYLGIPEADIEATVASGDLTQEDIRTYWEYLPTGTTYSCPMSDFSVSGNPFVPEDATLGYVLLYPDTTWVASLWRQNTHLGAYEILSSAIIQPTSGAPETTYAFSDTSAVLEFSVDLHSADVVDAPSGLDAYTLDWSALTVDASGNPFDALKASELLIAHVPDTTDVTALEPNFLTALDQSDTWLMNVYGQTEADLSEANAPEGGAFPGFSEGGLWFVALLDDSGNEPAPYFLTVVTVTAP